MSDLSLLINLGGAALFALVGCVVLAVSRGRARGVLVGAAATSFGMSWVFENVGRMTAFGTASIVGLVFFSALATVSLVALAYHLVRPLSRRVRAAVLTLCALAVLAWFGLYTSGFIGVYAAFTLSLVVVTGAISLAFHESGQDAPALACLGLAFAPFALFLHVAFAASAAFDVDRFGTGMDLVFLGVGAMAVATVVPFARSKGTGSIWPLAVFPVSVAAGLAALVLVVAEAPTFSQDYGSFGIIRTIGAFFLAVAVLRYDLVGVRLPRFAVQRGTLATGALAVLFVVAEVAQNFLSAEFGLLVGGVIAGTLLFVANPVQRAMERMHERGSGDPDILASTRREEAYLNAVRLVLRDRRLTRGEERHLAALADELGIGARRAHELLVNAEAEVGVA